MPDQINDLMGTFTYGVLVMLLPSFLGFALGSKWTSSIETVSEDIKTKSVQIIGEKEEFNVENEFENIQQNFNVLHGEFQSKIIELNEVSKKLFPLYFEKGEKIGRSTYLPENMRYSLMKRVKELAEEMSIKFGCCREGFTLNSAVCDGSWTIKDD